MIMINDDSKLYNTYAFIPNIKHMLCISLFVRESAFYFLHHSTFLEKYSASDYNIKNRFPDGKK